jgi:hypothetical protein
VAFFVEPYVTIDIRSVAADSYGGLQGHIGSAEKASNWRLPYLLLC